MSKMIKKSWSWLLVTLLAFAGASAWAGNVAKVGNTEYETIDAALVAARDAGARATSFKNGAVLELLADVTVIDGRNKNYGALQLGPDYVGDYTTIVGNGHTIKVSDDQAVGQKCYAVSFTGGNAKLVNLVVDANGRGKSAINLANANVVFEKVTVKNVKGTWSAFGVTDSTAVLNDCTAKEGVKQVISVSPGSAAGETVAAATINGGDYSGTLRTELSGPGTATLVITGGNFAFGDGETIDNAVDASKGTASISITGGTFGIDPSAFVTDAYKWVQTGENAWLIGVKVDTGAAVDTGKQTSSIDSVAAETVIAEKTVNLNGSEVKVKDQLQGTEVTGVKLTETATDSEAVSGVQAVIDAAKEKGEAAFKDALASASVVEVKVDVVVKPVACELTTTPNANVVTFEMTPRAMVTATKGETDYVQEVPVTNEMLDQTQDIKVSFFTGFKPSMVLHVQTPEEGGQLIESFKGDDDVRYDATTGYTTVTVHNFSQLTSINSDPVAMIGANRYTTLANALGVVANGETITLVGDATGEKAVISRPSPADFTIDLNGCGVGNVQVGFETESTTSDKLTLKGSKCTTGSLYVGQADLDDAKSIQGWENRSYELNVVGAEDIAFGQLHVRTTGTLNITNAVVSGTYILTYGAVNFKDAAYATAPGDGNVNIYVTGRPAKKADGKASLTLDHSTLTHTVGHNGGFEIGGGTAAGSGLVTVKNNSTLTANHLKLHAKDASVSGDIKIVVDNSKVVVCDYEYEGPRYGSIEMAAGDEFAIVVGANSEVSTGTFVNDGGTITVDMSGATECFYKLIDARSTANYGTFGFVEGKDNGYTLKVLGNDLYAVVKGALLVDDDWASLADGTEVTGGVIGLNAFGTIQKAVNAADVSDGAVTIRVKAGTYAETVSFYVYEWPGGWHNLENVKFNDGTTDWYGRIHFIADGEAIVTGGFHLGQDRVNNLRDIRISGFTINGGVDYPIAFESSGGTGRDLVVTANKITGASQAIYINSRTEEDILVSDNVISGASAYSIAVGAAGGTLDNVKVAGNRMTGSADIGIFGRVLADGVVVSNNLFDASSSGYALWVRNMTGTASDGKITLADNAITNGISVVIGLRNDTVKSDFTFGAGNTVDGVAITGWADVANGKFVVSNKGGSTNALYYDAKLYLGGETAFSDAKTAWDTASADGAFVLTVCGKPKEYAKAACKFVDNGDGTYRIAPFVAKIGEEKFVSVSEAVIAAASGQTIEMIEDAEIDSTVVIEKEVALDLAGKTVMTKVADDWAFQIDGGALSVGNGTFVDGAEGAGKGLFACDAGAAGLAATNLVIGSSSAPYLTSGGAVIYLSGSNAVSLCDVELHSNEAGLVAVGDENDVVITGDSTFAVNGTSVCIGIYCEGMSNLEVDGLLVDSQYYGIEVDDGASAVVSNVVLKCPTSNPFYVGGATAVVADSTFEAGTSAIGVAGEGVITVRGGLYSTTNGEYGRAVLKVYNSGGKITAESGVFTNAAKSGYAFVAFADSRNAGPINVGTDAQICLIEMNDGVYHGNLGFQHLAEMTIAGGRHDGKVTMTGDAGVDYLKVSGGIFAVDPSTSAYYKDRPCLVKGLVVKANDDETTRDAYPYLVSLPDFYQDLVDTSLWHVRTLAGLIEFRDRVNTGTQTFAGQTVRLDNDIDLSSVTAWTPIGSGPGGSAGMFHGSFDGNGKTVRNLTVEVKGGNNGFFGAIDGEKTAGVTSVVSNVTFDNIRILSVDTNAAGRIKGNMYGVIAATTYNKVRFESVTVTNCEVKAYGKVGGFVGMAADSFGETTFRNCRISSDTKVQGTYNCASFCGLCQNTFVDEGCVGKATFIQNSMIDPPDTNWEAIDAVIPGFAGTYCVDTKGGSYCVAWADKYVELAPGKKAETFGAEFADGIHYAAYIGAANYLTLAAAIDAVKANETIVLVADNAETIQMTTTVPFKIDSNGMKLTGSVEPAADHKFVLNGDGTCSYQAKVYVAQVGSAKFEELDEALAAVKEIPDGTLVILKGGEYPVATLGGSDYTIDATSADGAVTFTRSGSGWISDCDNVTVKGLVWKVTPAVYQYIKGVNAVGCTFIGLLCTHTATSFAGCTFRPDGDNQYCVNCYASDDIFTNCTFETDGKAIYCYGDGASNGGSAWRVSITDCRFSSKTKRKVAVFVKTFHNTPFDVSVDGCQLLDENWPKDNTEREGDEQAPMGANGLWGIQGEDTGLVTVRLDGRQVYPHVTVVVDPTSTNEVSVTTQSDSSVDEETVGRKVPTEEEKERVLANTAVTGVKLTTEAPVEGGESGVQMAVNAAKAAAKAAGDEAFEEAVTNATDIFIDVDVKVTPTLFDTKVGEPAAAQDVIFTLTPTATVRVVTNEVEAARQDVPVSNDMIDPAHPIKVTMYTGFRPSAILHVDDEGSVIESFSSDAYDETTGVVTVWISHFSSIRLKKLAGAEQEPVVATAGGELFGSVAAALAYVQDECYEGDVQVTVLTNSEEMLDGVYNFYCDAVIFDGPADADQPVTLTVDDTVGCIMYGSRLAFGPKLTLDALTLSLNASVNELKGKVILDDVAGDVTIVYPTAEVTCGSFTVSEGCSATLKVGGSTLVTTQSFDNNGTVVLDMAEVAGTDVKVVRNTGAAKTLADYGTLTLENNESHYFATVDGNDLHVKKCVAMIGEKEYASVAEAMAAAETAEKPVTVKVIVGALEEELVFPAAGITIEGLVSEGNPATTVSNVSGTLAGTVRNFEFLSSVEWRTFDGGTIDNCVFSGKNGIRWGNLQAGGLLVKDCIFNTEVYGAHFDGYAGTLTFRHCKMVGFNTFAASLDGVVFDDCTFDSIADNGYSVCQTWGNMVMTNCTVESGWLDNSPECTYIGNCTDDSVTEVYDAHLPAGRSPVSVFGDSDKTGIIAVNPQKGAGNVYTGGTFLGDESRIASVLDESLKPIVQEDGSFTPVLKQNVWTDWAPYAYEEAVDETNKVVTIKSAGDFAHFAKLTIAGTNYTGYTVVLEDDIDLSAHVWVPTGTFAGAFDGQDKTVSGLVVTNFQYMEVVDNAGLFGKTEGATVANVTLLAPTVKVTGSRAGALVGLCDATAVSKVNVTNATVSCADQAGGLIGCVKDSVVVSCSVAATVTATAGNGRAGGLAGTITGTDAEFAIQGNDIDVTLAADKRNPIAVLGAGQLTGFTGKLAEKVIGNWWSDATLGENSYAYTTEETGTDEQVIYRGVALIGTTPYPTIQAAIGAAAAGDRIDLFRSVTLETAGLTEDSAIFIDKSLTLNLGGNTVTVTAPQTDEGHQASALVLMNESAPFEVTITNGTIRTANACNGIVARNNAKLTLADVTVEQNGLSEAESYRHAAVTATKGAQVTIVNGSYKGEFYAVYNKANGGVITIEGGKFALTTDPESAITDFENRYPAVIRADYAIAAGNVLTINGGIFGKEGMKAGAVDFGGAEDNACTVNGGTFWGTVQSRYNKMAVQSGTFKATIYPTDLGHCGYYLVSGGTFMEDPSLAVHVNTDIAEGCVTKAMGTVPETWTVTRGLARIGTTLYQTLADAIEAYDGTEGDVILLDSCTGNGITIDKSLTVDFNGKTYTVNANPAGSDGTKTQAFQLLRDNDIVFKNGTIASTTGSGVQMLIQNYSNLTLENMILNGKFLDGSKPYTLSNNNGVTQINDGTVIIAKDGGIAFDAYYWPKQNYTNGVTVVVGEGASITGKIEYAHDGTRSQAEFESKATVVDHSGTIDPPNDYVWNLEGRLVAPVVKIGDQGYATLAEAVTNAESGATIDFQRSCEGCGFSINKSLTFNFNGKTYTVVGPSVGSQGTETQAFQLLKGNTIVFNGGTGEPGTIVSTSGSGVKMLVQNYANLVVRNMVLDGTNLDDPSKAAYTLSTNNGETLIDGSTIIAREGGTNVAFDVCCWSPYTNNLVAVTGSKTRIVGNIEISSYNGMPAALALDQCDEITGKLILGDDADNVTVVKAPGVTFGAPDGYVWDKDGFLAHAVWQIGEGEGAVKYATIQEAVNACTKGAAEPTTIKLLCNLTGPGCVVNGQNVVIDFCGFTYTVDRLVGSTGTETITFQLLKGSKVKMTDGTLTSTSTKMLVQNYADFTAVDMLFDGTQSALCGYVISNNNGTFNCVGSTSIWANEGAVAFDVCVTEYYPDGVAVTIDTTGVITGKVEYGVWDGLPPAYKSTLVFTNGTLVGAWDVDERLAEAATTNLNVWGGTFDRPVPQDYCAPWYVPAYDPETGKYGVKQSEVVLDHVEGRQRYPWNGLVDITFTCRSKKDLLLFVQANDQTNGFLNVKTVRLVKDDKSEEQIDLSAGGIPFDASSTNLVCHLIWDSNADEAKLTQSNKVDGITFKATAKVLKE